MSVVDAYQSRYEAGKEEELSIQDYLEICKSDASAYATAAERMLMAIGEAEFIDTRLDHRLSRHFSNKIVKLYPVFRDFYGPEDVIENIVSYRRHVAQSLEEKKILYLLGPVGGGKSSLAEKSKVLMEHGPPYGSKESPVDLRRRCCEGSRCRTVPVNTPANRRAGGGRQHPRGFAIFRQPLQWLRL